MSGTRCISGKQVALKVEKILGHDFHVRKSARVKIENAKEGDIWMYVEDKHNPERFRGISISKDGKVRGNASWGDDIEALSKAAEAAQITRNKGPLRFDPQCC